MKTIKLSAAALIFLFLFACQTSVLTVHAGNPSPLPNEDTVEILTLPRGDYQLK